MSDGSFSGSSLSSSSVWAAGVGLSEGTNAGASSTASGAVEEATGAVEPEAGADSECESKVGFAVAPTEATVVFS